MSKHLILYRIVSNGKAQKIGRSQVGKNLMLTLTYNLEFKSPGYKGENFQVYKLCGKRLCFYVFHVFNVLLTVCVVVFYQRHFIDLFSLFNKLTYFFTSLYILPLYPALVRLLSTSDTASYMLLRLELTPVFFKSRRRQGTRKR